MQQQPILPTGQRCGVSMLSVVTGAPVIRL
jgi:hypothetical protein